jgi:hypothetical protein
MKRNAFVIVTSSRVRYDMSLQTRSSLKAEKQMRMVGEEEVQVVYIAGKQNYGRVADTYSRGGRINRTMVGLLT